MRGFLPILSLAATLAVAASAQAGVIGDSAYLSGLLFNPNTGADPSITVGDKIFHHFTYNASGDMPDLVADPKGISVTPITDVAGNFGIRFTGGFGDNPGGSNSDAIIGYTVDVDPNSGLQISDAHIVGDPATSGVGKVSVTETWTPVDAFGLPGNPEAIIWSSSPGNTIDPNTGLPLPDNKLQDAVSFLPNTYPSLIVLKDIKADAGAALFNDLRNTSIADISVIDQTFSQTGIPNNGSTPEPMTLSIFGLGAGALLFRRSRKA